MISSELATFLESGISMLVGTRDARLFPDSLRIVGARVGAEGLELTVYIPVATGATAVANLRDNGRIAVCFSRPMDHRTIQIKGRAIEIRDADDADRAVIDRYRAEFAETLAFVGLPSRVTLRMSHWPAHAVRIRVESIFVQTPGPGAGQPLAPNSESTAR